MNEHQDERLMSFTYFYKIISIGFTHGYKKDGLELEKKDAGYGWDGWFQKSVCWRCNHGV